MSTVEESRSGMNCNSYWEARTLNEVANDADQLRDNARIRLAAIDDSVRGCRPYGAAIG